MPPDASLQATTVGVVTLLAMMAPSIWSKGKLKLFPIVVGLAVGHILAFATGMLTWSEVRAHPSSIVTCQS